MGYDPYGTGAPQLLDPDGILAWSQGVTVEGASRCAAAWCGNEDPPRPPDPRPAYSNNALSPMPDWGRPEPGVVTASGGVGRWPADCAHASGYECEDLSVYSHGMQALYIDPAAMTLW